MLRFFPSLMATKRSHGSKQVFLESLQRRLDLDLRDVTEFFWSAKQPPKTLKCLKNVQAAQSVVVGCGMRPAQHSELPVTGFPVGEPLGVPLSPRGLRKHDVD